MKSHMDEKETKVILAGAESVVKDALKTAIPKEEIPRILTLVTNVITPELKKIEVQYKDVAPEEIKIKHQERVAIRHGVRRVISSALKGKVPRKDMSQVKRILESKINKALINLEFTKKKKVVEEAEKKVVNS